MMSFLSFMFYISFLYLCYNLGVLQWHSVGVGVRSTNTIFIVRAGIYNSVFRRHAIAVHMNVSKTRILVSSMII